MMHRGDRKLFLAAVLLVACRIVHADGLVVDTIYHPYVDPLEWEAEYRGFYVEPNGPGQPSYQLHKLAIGKSLGNKWLIEGYAVNQQQDSGTPRLHSVELEAIHQLTEQGQYWADLGYSVEVAKLIDENAYEVTSRFMMEKELGRWSHTANLVLKAEWGSDINDEPELGLNFQSRYRLTPSFEPAIEVYTGESTRTAGPAVLGQIYLGQRHWLKWEAGAQFGLSKASPDDVFRVRVEYEF